jgi:phytoene desaturase
MIKQKIFGIIGGGVAGLSAGSYLARKGYHVKLFEANEKIGGSCATTDIDGYTFNDGALYLALPGVLDHVFMKLGLDRESLLPLRRIEKVQTTILPDGSYVIFEDSSGITLHKQGQPVDNIRIQKELKLVLEKWKPVLDLFQNDILLHPFSIGRMLRKGWKHFPKLRGNVASELRALFSNEAVQAALSGTLLFSGSPPEKTPIISLLGVIALLTEGFYLPEGGMGKIPEALSRGLTSNGGEIHLNARVNRILIKNGRAAGVDVNNLGKIKLDGLISSVSGMLTWKHLADPHSIPDKMRRKVETAPLSHKVLCLQLGLSNKIDVSSHSVNILPLMDKQHLVFLPDGQEVRWPVFFVPTVTMPELAPQGGSIVEMYPPIPQDLLLDEWNHERTEAITEKAIEALSNRYSMDIVVKRSLNPKDYQERLNLYKGAVYGLSPIVSPNKMFPHKTPVSGLLQAGQTTYPGYGISASAMSGIFAAQEIIKERNS